MVLRHSCEVKRLKACRTACCRSVTVRAVALQGVELGKCLLDEIEAGAEPVKVPAMRSINGKQAEGRATAAGVLPVIRPGRGKQVVRDVPGNARPAVWA